MKTESIIKFAQIDNDFGMLIEEIENQHDIYLEMQKINEELYSERRKFLRETKNLKNHPSA